MKITAMELCYIAISFAKPYHLSKLFGTLHDADAVILKLMVHQALV